MIYIKRGAGPRVLLDPDGLAAKEREKVLAFYKDRANKGKNYDFSVYSNTAVKEALERLFSGKCAYCESRYAGTQPMDVEHWRPKGGVRPEEGEEPVMRGYYWLASDWDNLLPSCIDCNRERKQRLEDLGGKARSVGKAERFPIEPGTPRAKAPGEETLERPLLLHPCKDRCEDYLEFTDEALIRPKRTGNPSALKAEKSIEVYALNRSGLVQERQQILMIIRQRISTIERLSVFLVRDDVKGKLRLLIQDLIIHEIVELRRFREPTRPFSAMARQFIDAFERKLRKGAAG